MQGKYKFLFLWFVLICVGLSGAYLFLPSHFQSLDGRVRDFYFKVRGEEKTTPNVVIVDIDEKSLKELGQWPWERDKFAHILENLTKKGAGIIGLDIVFAEADKTSPKRLAKQWHVDAKDLPDYDLILSKTVASTPTILGYVFDFDHTNSNEAPQIPAIFIQKHKPKIDFIPHAKGVLTNLPIIQSASYSSGYMNNIPDEMGIIRSVPLFIEYEDKLYPSLAFEMYRLALNVNKIVVSYNDAGVEDVKLANQHIKTDRFGKMYLNFKGPFKSYKYISAVDVYNDNVDKKDIEGKFVLIGTSAYGLMDLRSTPMDSVIAGVEIHANMIDNLLNDDMLSKPYWVDLANILLIVIISFVIVFLYSRLSLLSLFVVYSATFFLILYLNYYMLFSEHVVLNALFPPASAFLSLIGILGINYMFEFRQKEMVKKSFSKKVSKQVMEDLLDHPNALNLTSKEEEVTIYFSDIRNFTGISETLKSPKRITGFLNYYMDIMVKSVEKNSGTIDKFIGDAIMAYWNAPLRVKNHADMAVKTALKQIGQRDFLNKKISVDFGFDMDYGIGINTGNVVVGEIGSEGRSDYTIIGDSVNLASRLEGLCKAYKVRLVVSEFTVKKLKYEYVMQLLDIVRVKGKKEPVKIYEIISEGATDEQKRVELENYERAHQLYVGADFSEARELFITLYQTYKKPLYKIYEDRCEQLIQSSVVDFDGVFEFTTK